MTKEQGEAEVKFRIVKAVLVSVCEQGLITDDELQRLLRAACDMYHPIVPPHCRRIGGGEHCRRKPNKYFFLR